MDSKNADIQNAQANLLRLLVAKTLQKYGVTTERPSLSEQERKLLNESIHSLKDRAEYLVNHLQKKITENDPPVSPSPLAGNQSQASSNQWNEIKFRKRNRRK
ncbi:hypothetical protein ACQYAD_09290 [Neobacillus sp. SM06]|uniref:hypothetical protein n=1 Tax=Neobacillus sp. SM06 TaxID=3422492 RepID=UPI003D2CBDF1